MSAFDNLSEQNLLFSAFQLSQIVMTKAQETWIQTTESCPKVECLPKEGQAKKMSVMSFDSGIKYYHCSKCRTVWVIDSARSAPTDTSVTLIESPSRLTNPHQQIAKDLASYLETLENKNNENL